MLLSAMKERYDLHDSTIESSLYSKEGEKLVLTIEMLNWRQPLYREGETETILGEMAFTGVSFCNIQEGHHDFKLNDILNIHTLVPHDPGKERMEIIVLFLGIGGKENKAENIEIEAEDVTWKST